MPAPIRYRSWDCSGWFPKLSPDGQHILSGITDGAPFDGLYLDGVRVHGPGIPEKSHMHAWLDAQRIVMSSGMGLVQIDPPYVSGKLLADIAVNGVAGGGGRWATWSVVGEQRQLHASGAPSLTYFDAGDPALDETGHLAYAARQSSPTHDLLVDDVSQPLYTGALAHLQSRGGALGWVEYATPVPTAWVHHHGVNQNVTLLPHVGQYWTVPLPLNDLLWVLTTTDEKLLLARASDQYGIVIAEGQTDFPDARWLPDGSIRVVWSTRGVLQEAVVPNGVPLVHLPTVLEHIVPLPPPAAPPKPPQVRILSYGADRIEAENAADGTRLIVELHPTSRVGERDLHLTLRNSAGADRSAQPRLIQF